MVDQYLSPICNSLLAGYLRSACLQSGYQYKEKNCRPYAGRLTRRPAAPRLLVLVKGGRYPEEVKVDRGSEREAAAKTPGSWSLKVTAIAGPDRFRQLISNAIGKGRHLHV